MIADPFRAAMAEITAHQAAAGEPLDTTERVGQWTAALAALPRHDLLVEAVARAQETTGPAALRWATVKAAHTELMAEDVRARHPRPAPLTTAEHLEQIRLLRDRHPFIRHHEEHTPT